MPSPEPVPEPEEAMKTGRTSEGVCGHWKSQSLRRPPSRVPREEPNRRPRPKALGQRAPVADDDHPGRLCGGATPQTRQVTGAFRGGGGSFVRVEGGGGFTSGLAQKLDQKPETFDSLVIFCHIHLSLVGLLDFWTLEAHTLVGTKSGHTMPMAS